LPAGNLGQAEQLFADPRLRLTDRRAVRPFGFFTMLEFERLG
jgi:hypothetical protein